MVDFFKGYSRQFLFLIKKKLNKKKTWSIFSRGILGNSCFFFFLFQVFSGAIFNAVFPCFLGIYGLPNTMLFEHFHDFRVKKISSFFLIDRILNEWTPRYDVFYHIVVTVHEKMPSRLFLLFPMSTMSDNEQSLF